MGRSRRLSAWSAAAVGVTVTLSLGACGNSSNTNTGSGASGGPGGQVTLITTETPAWQTAITAELKKQTGVSLKVAASGANGVMETRLNAELQAGAVQTDVYEDIDRKYLADHASDFVDLSTAGLSNYASYPKDYTWKNICVDHKISVSGLVYNTSLVPADQVPKTWEDLLKPYWKGKIILSDPKAGSYYLYWALLMQKQFGDSYLKGIAAQKPALAESSVTAAQQVSAGAYQVSVLSQADSSSALVAQGAPLKFVLLTDPDIGSSACVGILKKAPHMEQAKAFLNFLMTPDAQSSACKAGVTVASPVNAPGCIQLPDGWAIGPKTSEGAYPDIDNTALTSQVLKDLGIS
jgi:iron(III) transport system substrate-binding protein